MIRLTRLFAMLAVMVLVVATEACSSSGPVDSATGPNTSSPASASSRSPVAAPTTKPFAAIPKTSSVLHLSQPLHPPAGPPGKLWVVAVGPTWRYPAPSNFEAVPVIVRNNTPRTLFDLSVKGVARFRGTVVDRGDAEHLSPLVVQPGEWAYGSVLFAPAPPAGATFVMTADARAAPSEVGNHVDLEIDTVVTTSGNALAGTLSNPSSGPVSGTISVDVACFAGALPIATLRSADLVLGAGSLSPGATAPFSVDLSVLAGGPANTCASYAISAQT